jgi:enamine deaminase RidA (YjgF/YER057c/UK114 family)
LSPATDVEYFPFPTPSPLPFSEAVRVGDMLYVSGQMGTDESLALVPGGIQAETRQALANIKAILERHGSSLDRVVKCTVMMADMSEWPAMNAAYVEHFHCTCRRGAHSGRRRLHSVDASTSRLSRPLTDSGQFSRRFLFPASAR